MAETGTGDFSSEMDHVLWDRCQIGYGESEPEVVVHHSERCSLC